MSACLKTRQQLTIAPNTEQRRYPAEHPQFPAISSNVMRLTALGHKRKPVCRFNPFEEYSSNWIISLIFDENKKIFETTTHSIPHMRRPQEVFFRGCCRKAIWCLVEPQQKKIWSTLIVEGNDWSTQKKEDPLHDQQNTYQSFEVSYLLSLYCLPSIYFKKK